MLLSSTSYHLGCAVGAPVISLVSLSSASPSSSDKMETV